MKRIKGSLRHLTRAAAPGFWPVLRKEFRWTVKPSPGPHPIARCIPLGILLRDVLGYASTMREARRILGERKVMVDGRVVRDYKFPVGLMDVVHIVPTGEYFRVLPHPQKVLALAPIPEEEAKFKLCRIENKTMVKGGNLQLNLHDGRNCLVELEDPMNPVEDVYKTLDTVKLAIPEQEILDHVKLEEGVLVCVVDGSHIGAVGVLREIKQVFKRRRAIAKVEDAREGREITTILDYVFAIGREKPLITIPEEW